MVVVSVAGTLTYGACVCLSLCFPVSKAFPLCFCLPSGLTHSYGRVYATADPYHHAIGPAATYSVGTMVSTTQHPSGCPAATAAAATMDA